MPDDIVANPPTNGVYPDEVKQGGAATEQLLQSKEANAVLVGLAHEELMNEIVHNILYTVGFYGLQARVIELEPLAIGDQAEQIASLEEKLTTTNEMADQLVVERDALQASLDEMVQRYRDQATPVDTNQLTTDEAEVEATVENGES